VTGAKHFRIEVGEAVQLIHANMPTYPTERVALEAAQGAILREPLTAERDQPPFDRVTMDGIAINSAALDQQQHFTLRGTQGAGAAAIPLGDSEHCVEIMTGAILPPDADTVVPVERIQRTNDRFTLEAGYTPEPGQFVHRTGTDHAKGQPLLAPGCVIGATEMAVLTITGQADVEIARWPEIAVISTGDELIDAGAPLETFQIRSSNDRAITAALEQRGCHSCRRAHLPDDPQQLRESISRMHDEQDVLILSGGVSMGKYDYVPQIMDELDVELVFHKILQRPGLPMWFGISTAGKPIFALPGNPVSTLVCMIRYVLPAIRNAMGANEPAQPIKLAEDVSFTPDLTCFMPVKLVHTDAGDRLAQPKPTNTSGDFISLARTDGFVELPRGPNTFPADYPAKFYAW
jgi:molybdopterin molybdotransferase